MERAREITSHIAWEEANKVVGSCGAHDIERAENWWRVYYETYEKRYPEVLKRTRQFAKTAARFSD